MGKVTRLVKVYGLSEDVEVIIKKCVVDGQHALTFNFVTELEGEMVNITVTSKYKLKEFRDKDFDNITKKKLKELGKTLPTFKEIL